MLARLFNNEYYLYILAALTSLALSAWIASNETIINPDAICYLMSAEKLGESSIRAIMDLCGQARWPFYSMLVYGLVKLSHLSYPTAAYLLDSFFSLLSVLAFLFIVKSIGGTKRVLWFAAITILCAHHFNSIREYIVRDHGFWTFYLFSIFFLLRYLARPRFFYALLFNASLILASLFRIEGFIFLLFMPQLIWLYKPFSFPVRFTSALALNALSFIGLIGLFTWMIIHPSNSLEKLGRLFELKIQIQQGASYVATHYHQAKIALTQYILNVDSAKHADLVLSLVLIAWFVSSIVINLSWTYSILFIYAIIKRAVPLKFASTLVLSGVIAINIVINFIFLLERFFLSKRYLVALTLILTLMVPFALDRLYQCSQKLTQRLVFLVAMLTVLVQGVGGTFDFGYSKAYVADAGQWISHHIPREARLYTNDYQLMYYSRHYQEDIFTKVREFIPDVPYLNKQIDQYDYFALRLRKKDNKATLIELVEKQMGKPIRVFANTRGDSVKIYARNLETKL
ncbi:MAG: hypothetical protein H0W64_00530 [Gammaproteobacteria bacterium]|nr:hypothetical protein [Gammaproteobacteria bacterium]